MISRIDQFKFLIKEDKYQDDALDKLKEVGNFDKLSELNKLILLSWSGDEQKAKRLNLKQIYKDGGGTFGMRMVKVRVKDVKDQVIDHKFSKEMAGQEGWLTPYIHYSDENEAYNVVYFDEIERHSKEGDVSLKNMPIMLDNVYPIGYGDEPSQFTEFDAKEKQKWLDFKKNHGLDEEEL